MNFLALELSPKSFSVTRCQATPSVHLNPAQQRQPAQPTWARAPTHVGVIRQQAESEGTATPEWGVGAARARDEAACPAASTPRDPVPGV